jgi:effector-binding domain-containing protein
VPARVDRFTGYRIYTPDQLADAAVGRRLRALDLPLDKVREVVLARDPELTRHILQQHTLAMQARLEETERIVAELQSHGAPATHTPVHVRFEPAQDTLRIAGRVPEAEFPTWIGEAFDRFVHFAELVEVAPAGPLGALHAAEIAEEGVEQVEVFIPLDARIAIPESERVVSLGEVPSAWCAVPVHVGSYDTMCETYRTLGEWVARHAEHAGERTREWYIVGPGQVDDVSAYRTEISGPIRQPHGVSA